MIVVDTSVWVAVFRLPPSAHTAVLASLLDADEVALPVTVRSELLMGVTGSTRKRLEDRLSGLPLLYTTDETWHVLDSWTARASGHGHHFGLGDLLTGVLAEEVGALVWSLDRDFERMEKLGLVTLYA